MVKNLPASAGDVKDSGLILGLERSPRGGNDYPLQYFCLRNPMDRRAWWATVHGVAKKSDTTEHTHTHCIFFFRSFSIIGHCKLLSIVPCAVH